MDQLIINGLTVDLPENTSIKYTRQISDIFDIAQVACSYTNTFSFFKTPRNTRAMQFLGMPGDSSNIPYIKNTAALKSGGFDLIPKGWFTPTETNDRYQGNILDGMVDFFKAIENKTLGLDLNLSNFEHEKTLANVTNSYSNQYYQYLVADYGGKTIYDNGINIDYLTPSFSVRKLWELIFSTFGFECDYSNLGYISNLWITYPKDITGTITEELIANLSKGYFTTIFLERGYLGSYRPAVPQSGFQNWDIAVVTEGSLSGNWRYILPETATYTFEIFIEAYSTYKAPNTYDLYTDPALTVFKNGIAVLNNYGYEDPSDDVGDIRTSSIKIACIAGDTIEILIRSSLKLRLEGQTGHTLYSITTNSLVLKVYRTDLGTTTLQNELKDFPIKDFIKEILWRTGLTPTYSPLTNIVSFTPLSSRVNFGVARDMTKFYKKRTGEIYQNDYAQKNAFKLKTDIPEDTTGEGYLYVNNVNVPDQKTIVQSKMYAPDRNIITQFFGFATNQYRIWSTETKLDEDDNILVSYKGLNGRFYFLRGLGTTGSFKFTSELLAASTTIGYLQYANNQDTLFDSAVFNNYQEYQKIFNNFRIHTISMVLTLTDFMGFDFLKPVFFQQEAAYYICNSLTYEEGKLSTGEFIKINNI